MKGESIMSKYRVYGKYIFEKILGEYEAESKEEAIKKALDELYENGNWEAVLCPSCSNDFCDHGVFDEESCCAELDEELE